jgi:YHS domain-containing protein
MRAVPLRVRHPLLAIALVASLAAALPAPGFALDPASTSAVNVNAEGLAAGGYDVVAYFTDGKPTLGSADFTATHAGATYRFASAAHRDTFMQDPAKYAPQFGGFCTVGASFGKKVDIDPMQWGVLDGKLYLNSGAQAQSLWLKDEAGTAAKAAAAWPAIKDKAPQQLDAN